MRHLFKSVCAPALLAATLYSAPATAHAQSARFNIPAQPLASALRVFGEQSGHSIVFETADATGYRSRGIRGSLDETVALTRLLAGSELVAVPVEGGFVIRPQPKRGLPQQGPAQVRPQALFTQPSPESTAHGDAASVDTSDIVVTARRSEERLQDVPISITVFNQEQLANRNVVSTADLATYTPSLSLNSRYGAEKASFAIRGFVQDQNTGPSVGVYFADVVAPRAQGGTTGGNGVGVGAMFDLQNVQVLKGPQGTLFGRNTTGGAVLIVPQKPTDQLEGYVEGTAGDYDLKRVQAVVNVPLAETFKVRLGVDRQVRDGYLKNHSGIGPDRFSDIDYWAFRVSIVADLTPDLENYVVANYTKSDTNGYQPRIGICNRTSTSITARLGCAQLDRQTTRGDGPWDVESGHTDPHLNTRQWQILNTTTWRASDSLTIKNIASYGEFRERGAFSINGDNFTFLAGMAGAGLPYTYQHLYTVPGRNNAAQSTFTEELQLQGENGALKWQAGVYLEISDPIGFSTGYTFSNACTDPLAFRCSNPTGVTGTVSHPQTKTYFNNKGIYAQGTYAFTEQLSFTGGIRYTADTIRQFGQNTRVRFPTPNNPEYVCTDTLRFRTSTGAALVVSSPSACAYAFKTKSQKPTWLIDDDYKPIDDVLLYAKYARGYRAGGISTLYIGLETWGPEKVDAYEVGLKASFGGESVRGYFNVAGFYNKFSNQQLNAALTAKPTSGLAGGTTIINAGKSRIYGAEVDASVTLFDSLKLDAGYTYLNTKLQSIVLPTLSPDSPFATIRSASEPGSALTYTPKHRLTGTVTYTLPLDESIGRISAGATYVYTSKQIATLASPIGILPASNLLNLNVNWNDVAGSPIDLALFVTNVANKAFPVSVNGGYANNGFDGYIMNQPRMWGVRMRCRFGE